MKIDVIIPSHQNPLGLRRLLQSFETSDRSHLSQILVVLNPENPDLETALLADFDGLPLRFFQTPHLGVNQARNIGTLNATAPLLIFMDDDEAILDTSLLQKHRSAHIAEPRLMALGGPYQLMGPTGTWSRAYHAAQMSWLIAGESLDGTNYHLLGGNVSFKKDLFARYLFNEYIVFGGAETELFSRLKRDKVFCRLDLNLSIQHFHNLSLKGYVKKAYLQGETHRKYGFEELHITGRKLLPQLTTAPKTSFEKLSYQIYFLVFNLGRKNFGFTKLRSLRFKNIFSAFRRKIFTLTLKIDFLTKKIDKTR